MTIRVLLAEDHEVTRRALEELLVREEDIELVGRARDGREALELCRELEPDVVLLDVVMPRLGGIAATERILAALPATRVVALSVHSDPRFLAGMRRAGAAAYLLKDRDLERLASVVRAVAGGPMAKLWPS